MSSLPMPSAWSEPLPEVTPPSGMAIYQAAHWHVRNPSGLRGQRRVVPRRASLRRDGDPGATPGGRPSDRRWLRHRRRSTCCGPPADSARSAYRRPRRCASNSTPAATTAAGYSVCWLTHAHWDHVSGLDEPAGSDLDQLERAPICGQGYGREGVPSGVHGTLE